MQAITFPATAKVNRLNSDRLGVIASVLCAIHCAAAPFLLLAMPAFGEIWAHPASHWGMAIFVIPLAVVMTVKGFRKHRRKWVLACAFVGVFFITLGAVLPYVKIGQDPANGISIPLPGENTQVVPTCADACCPSTTEIAGKASFHVPPAAIVTTLGGIALILTHLGNLGACHCCKKREV